MPSDNCVSRSGAQYLNRCVCAGHDRSHEVCMPRFIRVVWRITWLPQAWRNMVWDALLAGMCFIPRPGGSGGQRASLLSDWHLCSPPPPPDCSRPKPATGWTFLMWKSRTTVLRIGNFLSHQHAPRVENFTPTSWDGCSQSTDALKIWNKITFGLCV